MFYTTCLLQRIPNGKWQCPTCSVKSDLHDLKNNSDPLPKRARTKITLRKSDVGNRSVDTDKKSNQSLSKRKSPTSHPIQSIGENPVSANVIPSKRPSRLSSDGSEEGSSPVLKVDNDNLPELPPISTPTQTKPVSPAEASRAGLDTDKNEDISEKKSGVYNIIESPEKEVVPVLDAATRKVRKRKHKFYISDIQKNPKTSKNSCAINTLEKHGEEGNSGSCQTKKPHPKPVLKEKSSSARVSKPQRKHMAEEKSVSSQMSKPRRNNKNVSLGAAASPLKNDIGADLDVTSRNEVKISYVC